MKIQLPLENWVDSLKMVPREQLVYILQQVGDKKFISILQYYLNKCGVVTLRRMYIKSPANGNGLPIVHTYYEYAPGCKLPLADVPIPDNINNFERIHINYFDQSVLTFLKEFEHKSLLTNVHLTLGFTDDYDSDTYTQLMTNLSLITSLESINIGDFDIVAFLQSEYSGAMLASARVVHIRYKNKHIDGWLCRLYRWLCTPREDGKPKILDLYSGSGTFIPIVEYVKKEFLEANQAVSYFISIPRLEYREDFTDFSIDNSKTKEKFVIKHPKRNSLMISRYPIEMAANEEWIQEMEKYVDCHVVVKRCILIDLGNYYCSNN